MINKSSIIIKKQTNYWLINLPQLSIYPYLANLQCYWFDNYQSKKNYSSKAWRIFLFLPKFCFLKKILAETKYCPILFLTAHFPINLSENRYFCKNFAKNKNILKCIVQNRTLPHKKKLYGKIVMIVVMFYMCIVGWKEICELSLEL